MKKLKTLLTICLCLSVSLVGCQKSMPDIDGMRLSNSYIILKEELIPGEEIDRSIVDHVNELNKLSIYYTDFVYDALQKDVVDTGNPPDYTMKKPTSLEDGKTSWNELFDLMSANVFEDAAHVEKILINKGIKTKDISEKDYLKLVMYAFEYTAYKVVDGVTVQGRAELIENNNTIEDMIKAIENKFKEDINLDLDYEVENYTMQWTKSIFEGYIDKDEEFNIPA